MPKISNNDTPKELKPYLFQGVDVSYDSASGEAKGTCPFCDSTAFSVNTETSLYRCWKCNEHGNSKRFLNTLWEVSQDGTIDYEELVESRGISEETFMHWGIARSVASGHWLVPAFRYKKDGTVDLCQVSKFIIRDDGTSTLYASPKRPDLGMGQGLFGLNVFNPDCEIVILCEGAWDAMRLWEVLRQTRLDEGNYVPTSDKKDNLLQTVSVLGIAGCSGFSEDWRNMFDGKTVVLFFDNDHPKVNAKTKEPIEPAALSGIKRTVVILKSGASPPDRVWWYPWGPDGYDPDLESGTDIRDILTVESREEASEIVGSIIENIEEVPDKWVDKKEIEKKKEGGSAGLECIPCDSYEKVIAAWEEAMKWTEGLDCAFSVMLASIISTNTIGDQLWFKILGPASCGKSTLCEAVSTSPYIIAKSTIKGFHSGWMPGKKGEDGSLITKIKGKTLVTKDGDTLLQASNKNQILSEARDIYDTVSRTDYRNNVSNDYTGIRTTWLLCGTSSLRNIDSSELGERFLDCVIMEGIDDDLEDEILWRVATRAEKSAGEQVTEDATKQQEASMTKVMQLVGGYVNYLREHDSELIKKVTMSKKNLLFCTKLGKFVAYMRARPSKHQDETAEREFAARLVSQHVRLAKCLAAAIGRDEVDEEVMRRVRKCSLDTARGQTIEIAAVMAKHEGGVSLKPLSTIAGLTDYKTKSLLNFLKKIGAVKVSVKKDKSGNKTKPLWALTPRIKDLWDAIHPTDEES